MRETSISSEQFSLGGFARNENELDDSKEFERSAWPGLGDHLPSQDRNRALSAGAMEGVSEVGGELWSEFSL